AGDAAVARVGGRESLVASGLQGGAEGTGAGAQGAVRRQDALAVAAAEVGRAAVARRRVVGVMERGDGDAEGAAGGGAARSADHEMGSAVRVDVNAVTGAGDGAVSGVGGGDGLVAGRFQGGAEGAAAVAQRGVVRQAGVTVAAGEVDGAGVARG